MSPSAYAPILMNEPEPPKRKAASPAGGQHGPMSGS